MAPSDVHGQTAGAWTESEMARNPGGPLRPLPPGASNGAVEKRDSSSQPCQPRSPGEIFPGQGGFKDRSGDRKIADAREPKGNPLRRVQALHWLRSRLPRLPSHPRRRCRRGSRRWPTCAGRNSDPRRMEGALRATSTSRPGAAGSRQVVPALGMFPVDGSGFSAYRAPHSPANIQVSDDLGCGTKRRPG
jgi:hypothetical protein